MIVFMMLWPIWLLLICCEVYGLVVAFKRYPVLMAAVSTLVIIGLMNYLLGV